MSIKELCLKAKNSAKKIALLSSEEKNRLLCVIADSIINNSDKILEANKADISSANDKPQHFIDRLTLNVNRLNQMSDGIRELIKLPDPIGQIWDSYTNHCGLKIEKVSVPLGVIGIIYEARPNVTADAIGLCVKSGNSVVLRGSKDAINSNIAIVEVIKDAITKAGFDCECIQLITDTDRDSANQLMTANGYIDVLIPRGGAGLIQSVIKNSSVPVIETGAGNCHIYIESSANLADAVSIVVNAKVSRPSVCNAVETLLIDKDAAETFLPEILTQLEKNNVEIRGCDITKKYFTNTKLATEEDYATEFNDYIIAVKVVSGIDEAIAHIAKYSTSHSEAIISTTASACEKFLNEVDSAAVYVNASTRFTDGFEFGFGAEMGISTQKLHARGPMGLNELTSYKYKVRGNGQIRK